MLIDLGTLLTAAPANTGGAIVLAAVITGTAAIVAAIIGRKRGK